MRVRRIALIAVAAAGAAGALVWWRRRRDEPAPPPVQVGLADGGVRTFDAGDPVAAELQALAADVRDALVVKQ
jgi:hypothetical protein